MKKNLGSLLMVSKECQSPTIKIMNNDEIRDVCLKKDYEIYLKDKEIERLNNIINELESYLEQQWLEWKDDYNDEIVAMANEDKAVLNKLKELKGESDESKT